MDVAFCVSGYGALFRAAATHAPAIGIRPRLLVTETKSAADLDDFADSLEITRIRLDPRNRARFDEELASALDQADVQLIALTFDRIIPPALVKRYQGRMINVHPALLPAFVGTSAIQRLLASDARFGGATIHEVTDDVDAGPIIAQAVIPTIPDEEQGPYGRRMYALLEPMFLNVLRWYAEGRIDHDVDGRVRVRGARYGTLPISPADD